jgi:uncharacterized protein (UPF0128 family)
MTNFEYFLFKPPTDKPPVKVVLRGLHTQTKTDDIIKEVQAGGIEVISVAQLKRSSGSNAIPLPLFLLTLVNNEQAKKINDIKTINYLRVKFESYIKPRKPVQCYKCQIRTTQRPNA